MDLVKTFEEACAFKGYDPAEILPDVSKYPAHLQEALTATAKLFVVNEALKGDWVPDWQDYDQRKWYPWFDIEKSEANPSGFRFCASYYGLTGSLVGSRLVYPSSEISKYAATQFEDLYRVVMVIQ